MFEVNSRGQYFGEWGPPELMSANGLAELSLFLACMVSFLGAWPAAPFQVALLLVSMIFLVYSARTVPVAASVLLPRLDDVMASLDVDAVLVPDGHPLRAALQGRGWRTTSRAAGRTFLVPPTGP